MTPHDVEEAMRPLYGRVYAETEKGRALHQEGAGLVAELEQTGRALEAYDAALVKAGELLGYPFGSAS